MDNFFPFVHEKKKKEFEPQPLYVELIPPPPEHKEEQDSEESRVIIIEL